jgi:hypothetical protein
MTQPRTHATATVLRDGRVLVAGGGALGGSSFPSTSTAELFDPTTGDWAPAMPMSVARSFHTATLLPDGDVLVTGGADTYHLAHGKVTAGAELYDPSSDTWRPAASMSKARYHHAATLLADGRVLVAGGWAFTSNTDKSLAGAEIYDPAKNAWSATGSMATGRASTSMAALPDGRVLIAGGVNPAYKATATAEIWDPATGKWKLTGSLPTAVAWPSMAVLADGRVVAAGGSLDANASHSTAASCVFTPPAP